MFYQIQRLNPDTEAKFTKNLMVLFIAKSGAQIYKISEHLNTKKLKFKSLVFGVDGHQMDIRWGGGVVLVTRIGRGGKVGEGERRCDIIVVYVLWERYMCKLSVFKKDIYTERLTVGGEERREEVEVRVGEKREDRKKG